MASRYKYIIGYKAVSSKEVVTLGAQHGGSLRGA